MQRCLLTPIALFSSSSQHDAVTPDIRDIASQSLYDSTVGLLSGDTLASPSIYVTYHDAQAYPDVS